MSDVMKSELSAAFKQKGFLIAIIVVLGAALGLNATMQTVGLHFKKESVALRQPLDVLPKRMGPWLQISRDIPLPEEQEESLGTKDYITRVFIDTSAIKGFDQKQWDALSDEKKFMAAQGLLNQKPGAWIQLHMAYYTGLVDTVTHVPERCYVGGGYDPDHPQVMTITPFEGVAGRKPGLKVKYAEFVDRAQAERQRNNVGYFFQVNGAYEYDSYAGVRNRLQSIREKYAYYCKVEMLTHVEQDADQANKTMSSFMHYALPEIEKILPDWHAVTGERAVLNDDQ